MEQQQADALALLAETALHHGIDPGAPGERYQVVVHVDAPVLADADSRASRSSKTASAFPRKRRSAWPATPAGWSCATTPRATCWRSAPGRGRSRRRYAGRCSIVTRAVASRAAASGSARATTSATGPKAAHDAVQPRPAVSPAPPRGARGGLPGRARADGELTFRHPPARRSRTSASRRAPAIRSSPSERGTRPRAALDAHTASRAGGRAAGRRLRDRRAPPLARNG